MSLVKWNNYPDKSISSLLDNFFRRDVNDFMGEWSGIEPAVNIVETKNEYKVEVAVPGMHKESFEVKLDNDYLLISCNKEDSKEDKGENFVRKEFGYSSFSRSFHLPSDLVETDKIGASYIDGILCVTLPKRDKVKKQEEGPKQIPIS